MQIRNPPPGRMSDFSVVTVKPRGAPCQCSRCSAFVQASKTSSRGASKTRVMARSRSAAFESLLIFALLAAIFLLLFLYFAQIVIQTIEAFRPEPPIMLDP